IGERILSTAEDYAETATIVRHHHERFDGGGYPDRLAGAEIPLLSRIVGVADAYNAMVSIRPYRGALPTADARPELWREAGTHFDPAVVAAFDRVLERGADAFTIPTDVVGADTAARAANGPGADGGAGPAAAPVH